MPYVNLEMDLTTVRPIMNAVWRCWLMRTSPTRSVPVGLSWCLHSADNAVQCVRRVKILVWILRNSHCQTFSFRYFFKPCLKFVTDSRDLWRHCCLEDAKQTREEEWRAKSLWHRSIPAERPLLGWSRTFWWRYIQAAQCYGKNKTSCDCLALCAAQFLCLFVSFLHTTFYSNCHLFEKVGRSSSKHVIFISSYVCSLASERSA